MLLPVRQGSAIEAIKYANQNLAVQAAAAERRRQEARDLLQATGRTLVRLSQIGNRVAALVTEIELRRGKLHPVARAAHPDVPSRNRLWALGEGHVGQSVQYDCIGGTVR